MAALHLQLVLLYEDEIRSVEGGYAEVRPADGLVGRFRQKARAAPKEPRLPNTTAASLVVEIQHKDTVELDDVR